MIEPMFEASHLYAGVSSSKRFRRMLEMGLSTWVEPLMYLTHSLQNYIQSSISELLL